MTREFIVGSNNFFRDIEGFTSKDEDILIVEESPTEYKNFMQISRKGKCVFKWRKMTPQNFIKFTFWLDKTPMAAGKFLNKEFCEYIGFTITHLKKLEPVFEKLDEKHTYQKVIYDSYIENGKYYLTDEQRMKAYEVYKASR